VSDLPAIVETSDESFESDVIERSRVVPVVVDFWADWCQPCKTLTPLLEERFAAADGRWLLVKANTEQNPAAAGKFQVQGIPAVYAFVDGEIVDFFSGVIGPEQLDEWLARVVEQGGVLELRAMEESDPGGAAEKYRELLAEAPNDAKLQIGLLRSLHHHDDEACRGFLETLEKRGFLEPDAEKIKAALSIADGADYDLDSLVELVENEPENFQARLDLGTAQASSQEFEDALITLLSIVQDDRHGLGDAAREKMVEIFKVLPGDSELTSIYRRKLASALY
jgi:putative thioredoxin